MPKKIVTQDDTIEIAFAESTLPEEDRRAPEPDPEPVTIDDVADADVPIDVEPAVVVVDAAPNARIPDDRIGHVFEREDGARVDFNGNLIV